MTTIRRAASALTLLAMAILALALGCRKQPASGVAQTHRPHVTISAETTRIIEPLRVDGYVDYIVALNEHCSQGVTPANNAAVLFIQAVGPTEIYPQHREQYFRMLGIPPVPEEGQYLVEYEQYAARVRDAAVASTELSDAEQERVWDDIQLATTRPWSREALPTVAAWLDASERPLAIVVEATTRPQRWDPLVSTADPPLLFIPLPMAQAHRHAARALSARAMLTLGAGDASEAWHDLLACHRLGRLTGQGTTSIELLIAFAIEGIACEADRALLAQGDLTAAQARQMHDDLQALSPLPKVADVLNVGERYAFLDCVQSLAEGGPGDISRIANELDDKSSPLGKFLSRPAAASIDWDVVLRMGNAWFDRLVAVHRLPTWAERAAAEAQIDAELAHISQVVQDAQAFSASMLRGPGQAVSERMGQVLVALLIPAATGVAQAEFRTAEDLELVKLGLLLAAYRAACGNYPAQLSDLTPQYLAEVPMDAFSGNPLIYKPQPDGYILYSVGVNGQDDGGLGYADRGTPGDPNQDFDDLVVQVPLKQR